MNCDQKKNGSPFTKTRISIVMIADPDIIEKLDETCVTETRDRNILVKKILTDAKEKNEHS